MDLNISQFKLPTRPTTIRPSTPSLDMTQGRAALSSSNNLRLDQFKLNGNSWTGASNAQRQTMTPPEVGSTEAGGGQAIDTNAQTAGGKTSNFLGALGNNLLTTFVDPAVKFARSAIHAPVDIVNQLRGKGVDQSQVQLPSGAMSKTIQGGFTDEAANVVAGTETPLEATASAVGQTVGGAADTLGAAEIGDSKFIKMANDYVDKKLATTAEKSAFKESLGVVKPKLTKNETEEALAAGRGKTSKFGKVSINPDNRTLEVADATKNLVKKGNTGAQNINNVRQALSTEAEALKQGIASVDHPVTFKEINSKLNSIEKPITIKSDATLNRQFDMVKNALTKIIKGGKGNVSSLLDARKEFDKLVSKEFPNIYDRENAPMRNAVTSMRNAVNDFIEENLPDDVSYKESLKRQSLYYDAIDNIAGNSSSEVGTTKLGRVVEAAKKHPVVTAGAAAATAYELGKRTGI